MSCRSLLAFLSLVALVHSPAMAHRLDAEYERTEQGYRIEFFLGDGSPGADLQVTASREGDEPLEIGRTDAEGAINFVPPSAGEWTIVGAGAGHSTARNPLIINVDAVGEVVAPAAEDVAAPQAVAASEPKAARRGKFPLLEVAISFAFITFLTVVTLLMMRRSARALGRPAELEQMAHELAHLRESVAGLKKEVAELKANRAVRT